MQKYLRRKDDGFVITWNPSAAKETEIFEEFEADEPGQPERFLAPEDREPKPAKSKKKAGE